MKKMIMAACVSAMTVLGTTGCESMNPTQKGAVGGAALGAGVGAIAGDEKDALVGAGVGALGGALLGHEIGED